jgi:hypothetical protein
MKKKIQIIREDFPRSSNFVVYPVCGVSGSQLEFIEVCCSLHSHWCFMYTKAWSRLFSQRQDCIHFKVFTSFCAPSYSWSKWALWHVTSQVTTCSKGPEVCTTQEQKIYKPRGIPQIVKKTQHWVLHGMGGIKDTELSAYQSQCFQILTSSKPTHRKEEAAEILLSAGPGLRAFRPSQQLTTWLCNWSSGPKIKLQRFYYVVLVTCPNIQIKRWVVMDRERRFITWHRHAKGKRKVNIFCHL